MNTTFLTAIYARIKTVSALSNKVWVEVAPSTAQTPYAVFTYDSSVVNYDSEVFSLKVDVWADKNQTTTLDQITKSISDALQGYTYNSSTSGFKIYRQSTLMVPDPNETIRRRRLTFNVHTYLN
jgi:hypothetical protein